MAKDEGTTAAAWYACLFFTRLVTFILAVCFFLISSAYKSWSIPLACICMVLFLLLTLVHGCIRCLSEEDKNGSATCEDVLPEQDHGSDTAQIFTVHGFSNEGVEGYENPARSLDDVTIELPPPYDEVESAEPPSYEEAVKNKDY